MTRPPSSYLTCHQPYLGRPCSDGRSQRGSLTGISHRSHTTAVPWRAGGHTATTSWCVCVFVYLIAFVFVFVFVFLFVFVHVCVCECVCVCNKCLVGFNSFLIFSCLTLLPSFFAVLIPLQLYAASSAAPAIHRLSLYSLPTSCLLVNHVFHLNFSLSMARVVPSPPKPTAPVIARCAPPCPKGRGGVGCWTSLLLVTSFPSQIHTTQVISDSYMESSSVYNLFCVHKASDPGILSVEYTIGVKEHLPSRQA